MKHWLTILCLAVPFLVRAANPFEQRVAWTPTPSPNISVYVLYIATNAAATNWQRVAVTNLNWLNLTTQITNGWLKTHFTPGVTNWLMLTAKDDNGVESEPSNVISFVPPRPPGVLRLTVQIAPTVNGPWTDLPEPVAVPMWTERLFARLQPERRWQ